MSETFDKSTKEKVGKIPLLNVNAGPRDKDKWEDRLKEVGENICFTPKMSEPFVRGLPLQPCQGRTGALLDGQVQGSKFRALLQHQAYPCTKACKVGRDAGTVTFCIATFNLFSNQLYVTHG